MTTPPQDVMVHPWPMKPLTAMQGLEAHKRRMNFVRLLHSLRYCEGKTFNGRSAGSTPAGGI
jgi:hypothetical protein